MTQAELKIGDNVTIIGRHHHPEISTIVRETKTLWVVGKGERKFRKSDLYEPGGGNSVWSTAHIEPTTDKHREDIDKRNLRTTIERGSLHSLTLQQLRDIVTIMNQAV